MPPGPRRTSLPRRPRFRLTRPSSRQRKARNMPIATIIALFQALMSLAPQIPDLIQAVETAISLLQSGTAPTAEQQAQIDAALDAANKAVQGA